VGRARGEQAEAVGCGGRSGPIAERIPFLFLFLIFQSHFSKDF
jgi:hypothetical protein